MDEVGWSVLGLAVLTGVSLFYTLNNLALRSYSFVKLQDAFKARNRESSADRLVEREEKLILTCSLFRLIANTGILGVLAHLMILEGLGFAWFFVLAVLILAVFSFAVPYSWAKYMCETILVHTYRVLGLSAWLATPVLGLMSLHDRLVRRLAGVAESSPEEEQEEKHEEILNFVEQSRMEGVVDEEELAMIENVLELSDTTAEEIMTPRTDVHAIEVNTDLPTVVRMISDAGHSRIPVYEGNIDNIIGLVYAKDLLSEIGRDKADFSLRDKIRKAYFVPENKPLRVLLHEFQNQKLHIAVVLDEYGGTAGIVTIEDILEELVGEIVDEYEEMPPASMVRVNETTVEIDARMYVDDLNEEFDVELPEDEDYDTVGGFVFSHLGYIPKTGESFEYRNLKFTVVSAGPRQVKRLRIEKPSPSEKANQ